MRKTIRLDSFIPIQNAQLLAIEGILENTPEFFERKVRRWFSKEHSTPYLDTFKIPWDELLLHYYESSLSKRTYNEVFDIAVEEYLPEFINKEEQELEEFAKSLLNEQKATIKARSDKDKGKSTPKKQTQQKPFKEEKEKSQSNKNKLDKKQTDKPEIKTMSLKFEDLDPDEEDIS